jgi:hypothetical protein
MTSFKSHSYDQTAMVVIVFDAQLQRDPFSLTLRNCIDKCNDLSVFHEKYNHDAGRRSACNPSSLLEIIPCAYANHVMCLGAIT